MHHDIDELGAEHRRIAACVTIRLRAAKKTAVAKRPAALQASGSGERRVDKDAIERLISDGREHNLSSDKIAEQIIALAQDRLGATR